MITLCSITEKLSQVGEAMSVYPGIPDRSRIEKIVRNVLELRQDELFRLINSGADNGNPLVVNVSARHVHLTRESLETLFGPGTELTEFKTLYNGEFASEQRVNIVASRNRMISNIRILAPLRDYDQVELSYSDGVYLGLDLPLRTSGDHSGTPGCTIVGPNGSIQLNQGVMRVRRHIHMGKEDLEAYGVKDGDFMKLSVKGECGVVFDNVVVRYGKGMKLEVHIDTDEGNACNLQSATRLELIKQEN